MNNDLKSDIIATISPVIAMMAVAIVFSVIRFIKRDRAGNVQSKRETDALIEAQAMLAKAQLESSEETVKAKESKAEISPESKIETKEAKNSKNKTEENRSTKKPKQSKKPTVLTDKLYELEGDIDKA